MLLVAISCYSFYAELARVLKPVGWLISNEAPGTPTYETWRTHLKDAEMIFHFASPDETATGFSNAGLRHIQVSENFDCITGTHRGHHKRVHGSTKQALRDALGDDGYAVLIVRMQNRIDAIENGTLLHCNFRAQK